MLKKLAFLTILATATARADWATYQGNAGHTGYVPSSANLSLLQPTWYRSEANYDVNLGMAVGAGQVFITARLNIPPWSRFYALSDITGQVTWSKEFWSDERFYPPAVSDGKAYFQSVGGQNERFLRCYDANLGLLVFRAPFATHQFTEYFAPTISDHEVYISGGQFGGMYSFSAIDGFERWFCNILPQAYMWTPTVGSTHCYAYLPYRYTNSGDAGIYAVNRLTGAADYQIIDVSFVEDFGTRTPALDGFACYVTNGGRLLKFDLNSRNIAWQTKRNFRGPVTVTPSAAFGIDSGAVTALDKASGAFLFQMESSHGNIIDALIATDTHVIARTETHTVIFDLASRQQVWAYPGSGPMALSNDSLYIAGNPVRKFAIGNGDYELQTLQLSRDSVAGANSVLATVTIGGVATKDELVKMWDTTEFITTPATVKILKGSNFSSARLTTTPVYVPAMRTVYARFGGATKTADLLLKPYGPTAMRISPTSVRGGVSPNGRVVLNGPAPASGQEVMLTTDSPYASVPSTVTVPPGSAQAIFVVGTLPPPQDVVTRITARVKWMTTGGSLRVRKN